MPVWGNLGAPSIPPKKGSTARARRMATGSSTSVPMSGPAAGASRARIRSRIPAMLRDMPSRSPRKASASERSTCGKPGRCQRGSGGK